MSLYDAIGQLISARGREADGQARLHEQLGYAYDAAGNLNFRTNNALVQQFAVNGLNELSGVTRSGSLTVAGFTTAGGSNVTVNGLSANLYRDLTFASPNQTMVDGLNTFNVQAQATNGPVASSSIALNLPVTNDYVYDLNGNMTFDGQKAYEYDDENELVRVTVTNAWKSEFVYDGKLRRRIRKEFTWASNTWSETNEVHYVYDGNLVVQERWFDPSVSTNTPQQYVTYTRGLDLSGTFQDAGGIGGMLARSAASTLNGQPSTAFYHADGNGNVSCLVDASQLVVARYIYDPYGNQLATMGALAEPNLYRFSSKEYHPNSGLVYYLYRYYSPSVQRWINRDPMGESGFELVNTEKTSMREQANRYLFVANNPVIHVDFVGLDLELVIEEAYNILEHGAPADASAALRVFGSCSSLGLAIAMLEKQRTDCYGDAFAGPPDKMSAAEAACACKYDKKIKKLRDLYDAKCKGK